MPKFYYPSPDELQGAEPLVEEQWFERYQHILVSLANTVEGRALLLIDDRHIPIVEVRKNSVRYDIGGGMYITDFRVGAKWANVIRYRWQEVKKAYDRMLLRSILDYPPTYSRDGRLLHPVGGGLTLTAYPDPHSEVTSVDGTVTRTGINEDWAPKRTGDGHPSYASNDSGEQMPGGNLHCYPSTTWRTNERAIACFDTSALGSTADISAAVLSLVARSRIDTFSDSVAIVETIGPATLTDLVADDYQNSFDTSGTMTLLADLKTYAGLTVNSSTYTDFPFLTAGKAAIELAGVTTIGIMGDHDRDDNEPGFVSDSSGVIQWGCADLAGTSTDPKLVVTYTVPFTPKLIIF